MFEIPVKKNHTSDFLALINRDVIFLLLDSLCAKILYISVANSSLNFSLDFIARDVAAFYNVCVRQLSSRTTRCIQVYPWQSFGSELTGKKPDPSLQKKHDPDPNFKI